MKDNFSGHASAYSLFRPKYPLGLYEFLLSEVQEKFVAWDCGTGNGQVAAVLADFFERVEATDISAQQLAQAPQKPNIKYSQSPAEDSGFARNTFDLITVAQAVHWFDFQRFFAEVSRALKPNGIIALIGYGLVKLDEGDDIIAYLYEGILGDYWDPERKYIEQNYESIPFDFEIIETPKLWMEYEWNFDQFMGYLNTWSAVKHYEKASGKNPLNLVEKQIRKVWGTREKAKLKFPIILKVGRNIK